MVILQEGRKFLFLNEYRRGLRKLSLGFPGGLIEDREKPIQSIKRELLEETGLVAKNWKLLFTYLRYGTYKCGKDYVFFAKVIRKNQLRKNENINKIWMDKKTIVSHLNKGKFETSGVMAAVLYCLFKKLY